MSKIFFTSKKAATTASAESASETAGESCASCCERDVGRMAARVERTAALAVSAAAATEATMAAAGAAAAATELLRRDWCVFRFFRRESGTERKRPRGERRPTWRLKGKE